MEDVIDSLLVRVEGCEPNADQASFKKLMARMANLFKKGKSCHDIVTAVEEIHERLQDVSSRHKRYNLANLHAATRTTVDPFLEVLYGDKKNIIGIEKARDDIIKKISDGGQSMQRPEILSIVGFGGVGKTTLAREVYDALPTKFDYRAFVSVSRNPDMKKVLSNLLFKLDNRRHANLNAANLDVEQLIILVRELLSKKRYFIIIDDLWNKEAWTTIRYALNDDECGSIIITTTRLMDVSKVCCSSKDDMIHKMKSLSLDDSQKLFHRRIFSCEVCPSRLEQVSRKILKKCAGVPLAIISLASYLANNQRFNQIDQWYVLLNSVGRGLEKGDDHVKEMKRILSLSFYDLPSYLKTCFLYLSIFPEDHQIGRDRLIRRWACEGFIQVENETTSLLELGDSYFNQLVNRNMIEPIIHDDGSVEACCVHDLMLDLICEVSSKENFVTILDFIEGDTPSGKKFRRLSLQKGMTDLTTTRMANTSMSQVRSFTAFSPTVSKIPSLYRFQVLRVLDLEGCDLRKSPGIDLRHVEKLLHLRYLGLRGTKVGKLPMDIGKLQFLQTLDLQWTNSKELASSVVQLRHLVCLILDLGMPLPNGFSNLKCLEQLTGHGVGIFTADSAKELG
uniref:NB-ARC domain-containing protein n=1 Tax=Triticum urartu TaxID=4572 RepID=A0A8R7TPW0_TRIUA